MFSVHVKVTCLYAVLRSRVSKTVSGSRGPSGLHVTGPVMEGSESGHVASLRCLMVSPARESY